MASEHIPFPRHSARTQRFTLGAPRSFRITPDGSTVLFIRSKHGSDGVGCLWAYDVASGDERLLADPAELLGAAGEELSAEERSRRERARESTAGVVAYDVDRDGRLAVFALSGEVWAADVAGGDPRRLPTSGGAVDPRLDPSGSRVAYASGGSLRVVDVAESVDRAVVEPDGPEVSWGVAEFVAAEELDRSRGFWWSPDGTRLLVARVDESPVQVWHVADPANPGSAPVEQRYPAAGTDNAAVTLWVVSADASATSGVRAPVQVAWDTEAYPYLASVSWTDGRPPVAQVLSRRQDRAATLSIDVETGAVQVAREQRDDAWVDVVPGVPAWLPDGRLLTVEVVGDRYALCADGLALTASDNNVRAVRDVGDDGVLVVVQPVDDPTSRHLVRVVGEAVESLSSGAGVHNGRRSAGVLVRTTATLDAVGSAVSVDADGAVGSITSYADVPGVTPRVSLLRAGRHDVTTAVLLPTGWEPGQGRLPVLMDPYGGPHGPRVVSAQSAFLASQWLADQGFAVVVADGRGTPREPSFERAVRLDLAGPVLEDQVDALHAAADAHPDLDLTRVGIRGWSFGGYLAALAVLERPDVFHAAVAGAPVTEWRLYDTAYTERYLGLPQEQADAYDASSLLTRADKLERPLLVVHGLADDNVVAAHTLRLSSALLEAGRPHSVLPLSGVTHMTPQEVVAENLLLLQVDFLRQHLAA